MNYWKKEEQSFLIDNFSSLPTKEIALKLNRTHLAIWKKAKKLGLKLTPQMASLNRSVSRQGILFKGGRKKNWKGYVLILQHNHPRADRNGYVFEHIIVAEKKIGRPLKANECVHHINEVKDDNRADNLMVLTKGEHSKYHNSERRKCI